MRRLSTLLLALVIASAAVEPAALRCVFGAEPPATHGCCAQTPAVSAGHTNQCCTLGAPRDAGVPPTSTPAMGSQLASPPAPVAHVNTFTAAPPLPVRTSSPTTHDLPTLYSVLLI